MWFDDDDDAISAAGFGQLVIENIHTNTDIRTIEAWGMFAGRYGRLALNHREQRPHAHLRLVDQAFATIPELIGGRR